MDLTASLSLDLSAETLSLLPSFHDHSTLFRHRLKTFLFLSIVTSQAARTRTLQIFELNSTELLLLMYTDPAFISCFSLLF